MYYPKQIPYLLDKEFKKHVTYSEYNIKELDRYCMCIWTMKSKEILEKVIENNILPDACMDIVIDFKNRIISLAGFGKETVPFHLNQKIDYMGVRLKPSVACELFQIDAGDMMDQIIPFSVVETEFSLEPILELENTSERIRYLQNYLLTKTKDKPGTPFLDVVEHLYHHPKEQNVIAIAQKFGYNKRHLYRVFKTKYGVSPKVLFNILRLHLCLTLILEDNRNLTDIAHLCGFYDQSHFIKEIKKYTGVSPLKILENHQ